MSELGGNYSPEQEFRNRPMYTGEGISVPEMSEDLVFQLPFGEPDEARDFLKIKNDYYAQRVPYQGGTLSHESMRMEKFKVEISFMSKILEDGITIGYTLRPPEDVKNFLKKEYEKNKSVAA